MRIVGGIRANGSHTDERVRALSPNHFILRGEQVPEGTDLYVQAGFQNCPALESCMDTGVPFVVLENGLADCTFRKRSDYVSVGYNGLGGIAFRPEHPDYDRLTIPMEPWRTQDHGAIVIYGQMENDRSLRGLDMESWLARMELHYRVTHPERQVLKRRHPKMFSSWESGPGPLADTFDQTWLSASWTSTAGIEAVLAGVRHEAWHKGSMVSQIEYGEDRTQWRRDLTWSQYTLEELATVGRDYLIAGYAEARSRAQLGLYDNPGPMPLAYT